MNIPTIKKKIFAVNKLPANFQEHAQIQTRRTTPIPHILFPHHMFHLTNSNTKRLFF